MQCQLHSLFERDICVSVVKGDLIKEWELPGNIFIIFLGSAVTET